MSVIIKAPWTDEQVKNLEEWQDSPLVHPFTWDKDVNGFSLEGHVNLLPTKQGWRVKLKGPVVEDWAWDFMLDGSCLKAIRKSPLMAEYEKEVNREAGKYE
jgi:hypothetical protein